MSKKLSIHQQNQKIRELIQKKDQKGEEFTMSELEFLSLYEGKGGQAANGEKGEGLLYEFYTPTWVVELMWQLARFHGYRNGSILEPSFATGRFFKEAPDESLVTGFEIDPVSFRIAQLLYPKAKLYNQYFETAFLEAPRYTKRIPPQKLTWLSQYPFSLVIGNPPYGKHRNLYSSYFSSPRMAQMELFFIYWGLKLLRPGGLLIYITSSNILRNGLSYETEKLAIEKLADLKDAYRLPPVFQSSQVPTDILILKRKENG
jgi:hypothetical protein